MGLFYATTAHALDKDATTYRFFGVTEQDGRVKGIVPEPCAIPPLWAVDVRQAPHDWPPPAAPLLAVEPFIIPPGTASQDAFYPHNHCPAITWLPNGDVLAIWFSTIREQGTEMTIVASRRRTQTGAWDPAAELEGYLAVTQSPDGVIQLVSSRLYYRFNLAWLETESDI